MKTEEQDELPMDQELDQEDQDEEDEDELEEEEEEEEEEEDDDDVFEDAATKRRRSSASKRKVSKETQDEKKSTRKRKKSTTESNPPAEGNEALGKDAQLVLQYLRARGYTQAEEALLKDIKDDDDQQVEQGEEDGEEEEQDSDGGNRKKGKRGRKKGWRKNSTVSNKPAVLSPDVLLMQSASLAAAAPSAESLPYSLHEKSYVLLRKWIEESMDIYRFELRRVLYPIFIHSYIDLISRGHIEHAKHLMDTVKSDHSDTHSADLVRLESLSDPGHLKENDLVQTYLSRRYLVKMSRYSFELLLSFLQEEGASQSGLIVLLRLINEHINIQVSTERPKIDKDDLMEMEAGPDMSDVTAGFTEQIKLSKLPPDPWLVKEMERSMREEPMPPHEVSKMMEEVDKLKKEPAADAPSREDIPLPPTKLVDINMQMRQFQEVRRRVYTAPTKTPSICCYTMHNTYEGMCSLRMSQDGSMTVGGFADSLIRVWNMKGDYAAPITRQTVPTSLNGRPLKFIGHMGPVYGACPSHDNRFLISCSEDTTVRLWSMETRSNLVCYKGHNYPVWDVDFGPLGVYFASASYDRTARLWSCEHIQPLRLFVGHLADTVRFHPNGNYILTGSSDRTCRLWDIQRGRCVRLLTRHLAPIHCVSFSPDGKTAATSGEDAAIILWDLGSGKPIKKMLGHGSKVNTLVFSNDGSTLVSGSMDYTVRLWDVKKAGGPASVEAGDENKSPDLISTFYTKRTPIYALHPHQNSLIYAMGAFLPL